MIGQDIALALPELRAQAESLMPDTCEVRAKASAGAADATTGVRTAAAGSLKYSGKCRVRRGNNLADTDQRAEQTIKVARYFITVPVEVAAVRGDLVTVTESTDALIPTGTFAVVEVVEGTHRFQRRLLCTRDT